MTPMKLWFPVAFVALIASNASSAEADSVRCGRKLVSDGDSTYQVRSTCGEPHAATRRVEQRTYRRYLPGPCADGAHKRRCGVVEEYTVQVMIDEWTYDFGSNRFLQFLTFEQGQLVRVRSGSYGQKDPS